MTKPRKLSQVEFDSYHLSSDGFFIKLDASIFLRASAIFVISTEVGDGLIAIKYRAS